MSLDLRKMPVRWNLECAIDGVNYFGDPPVDQSVLDEIRKLRDEFGNDLLVLGHHYQRDAIIQFSDKIEDSLALSQFAQAEDDARTILFLGIHIMAETADMLTDDDTVVLLPDLKAGCTMGDLAPVAKIEDCWKELSAILDMDSVIPISYVNATASVKAFSGKHNGATCTSSNTAKVMQWAMDNGEKILFLPDRNLGRNTAYTLGIPDDHVILWDPILPLGGNSETDIKNAKVIAWKGYCSIHEHFSVDYINELRSKHPDINILVHPEVGHDVFRVADGFGSTSQIISRIKNAEAGSRWAVGTEFHMVNRLANDVADKGIIVENLAPFASLCTPMFRINANAVLETLKALKKGEYRWQVKVDPETKKYASIALNKMFEITK